MTPEQIVGAVLLAFSVIGLLWVCVARKAEQRPIAWLPDDDSQSVRRDLIDLHWNKSNVVPFPRQGVRS